MHTVFEVENLNPVSEVRFWKLFTHNCTALSTLFNDLPRTHEAKSSTNKAQSQPFNRTFTALLISGDRMLLCGTPISCCEWQTVCTNETCCDCQYYENTAKVKMLRATDRMLSCWTPISCCEWQINCTNETCGDCHHNKNKSKRKNKLSAFLKGRSNQSSTHIFTSNKQTEVFYRKRWRGRGKEEGWWWHKHEWTLKTTTTTTTTKNNNKNEK